MTSQHRNNKLIFAANNIGDKLMITEGDEVIFGIISNFGYNDERDMILWVDVVGMREIRPYNPRSTKYNIEVLK